MLKLDKCPDIRKINVFILCLYKLTREHHERNINFVYKCQNTAACSNFACMFMIILIDEKSHKISRKKTKV